MVACSQMPIALIAYFKLASPVVPVVATDVVERLEVITDSVASVEACRFTETWAERSLPQPETTRAKHTRLRIRAPLSGLDTYSPGYPDRLPSTTVPISSWSPPGRRQLLPRA